MKSRTDKSRPQMFQEVQIWTRTARASEIHTLILSFYCSTAGLPLFKVTLELKISPEMSCLHKIQVKKAAVQYKLRR